MAPMKNSRTDACCAINDVSNEIYVMGGVINDQDTASCEKLDISRNKWSQLPPLNEAKNLMTSLIINNSHLYVFGGACGASHEIDLTYQSVSIEVLDLHPNSKENFIWDLLQVRLQLPLWGIGALELSKGKIMLFGG